MHLTNKRIGGGNMAAAIISGLIAKNFDKSKITVSEPWDVNRQKMADLGVRTTASNVEAATGASIIILAVKPQIAKTVCQELASSALSSGSHPLIVSIAAGITAKSLGEWTRTAQGHSPPIVRVMPNTPALLGEGASGIYAGADVSKEQKAQVTALLGSVSRAIEWVDNEELLDVVTGLSGSGPACKSRLQPCIQIITLYLSLTVISRLLRHGRAFSRQCYQTRPP